MSVVGILLEAHDPTGELAGRRRREPVGSKGRRRAIRHAFELLDPEEALAGEAGRLGIDDVGHRVLAQTLEQRRIRARVRSLNDPRSHPTAAIEERWSCERVLDGAAVVLGDPHQNRRFVEELGAVLRRVRHSCDTVCDRSDDTRKAQSVVLAAKLEQASSAIELDQADIARVLEANPRTVARWIRGDTEPRPDARERLLELIAVLERLSGVLKPAAAHDWLFTPNPSLDHHKPVDLLREREYRRVLGAIDALAEGVYA